MKKSIRKKMLFNMLVIVFFFIILVFFSNMFLVERLYVNAKKNELLKLSENVKEILNTEIKEITDTQISVSEKFFPDLSKAEYNSGSQIRLISEEDYIIYPDMRFFSTITAAQLYTAPTARLQMQESPRAIFGQTRDAREDSGNTSAAYGDENNLFIIQQEGVNLEEHKLIGEDEISFFSYTKIPNLESYDLTYYEEMDNGLRLLLSTPVAIIDQTIGFFNKTITIISLVMIIFTVVWSLYISHRFTKPITEIQNITEKMKDLNFSEKIDVQTEDEIGKLGTHINSLSNTLSKTIDELNIKNKKLGEEIERERKIDKMRRDFISNVSHELKTPIFLIQGYADGLKENIALDEKKDIYCDVISSEANKMDSLVKDLLTIARLETENVNQINKFKTEINSFTADIIDKYNLSNENDVAIKLIKEPEDINVMIDKIKIEQVITNILNNALYHVDNKKIIEVKIINKKNENENENVKIEIFNSGNHIDEESIEKIWDEFYKQDTSRNRQSGRVGLGLSIVKNILNLHEGEYGAHNSEGGVKFWFSLKICNSECNI